MSLGYLPIYEVRELDEFFEEDEEFYNCKEVDTYFNKGKSLLSMYKTTKDFHGEDSKQAKESLEDLLQWFEAMN